MNRNQRKYGRASPKKDDDKFKAINAKPKPDIEEVLSPRIRRTEYKYDKSVANRCCYIKPNLKDVEQSVDNNSLDLHFKDLIKQQYDFDPMYPDAIKNLRHLRKALCSSQSTNTKPLSFVETSDGSQWQNVENTADLDQLLIADNGAIANASIFKPVDSKNIYISEVPRIKVIAEKFSKFSRNNVELRRLDEKIVCIEYDVFENDISKDDKDSDQPPPVQKMRAYFSVKPTKCTNAEKSVTVLPSTIKQKFHINEEDLQKLNEKEIEIIDEKNAENKPYLDELKRVLKRKQAIYTKRQKSCLDLKNLYQIAKMESPSLDEDFSNTNLLSKAELDEIKDLIMKKCVSSVHGINRHTLKHEQNLEPKGEKNCINVISQSIFAELIRNDCV